MHCLLKAFVISWHTGKYKHKPLAEKILQLNLGKVAKIPHLWLSRNKRTTLLYKKDYSFVANYKVSKAYSLAGRSETPKHFYRAFLE